MPRSAEELRRFDLVPFFAVTGGAADELQRVDGLQCANIRYQGDNIRTETRPVCVDEAAFRTVIELAGYGDWRVRGLVLSDGLGTRAMRRWYGVEPFPHRQVARDALLAGNDLLVLDDFGPEPGASSYQNIVDTVQFFTEGYRSDPVFAARVDESLRRILRHKLSLYGEDPIFETVVSPDASLAAVGQQSSILFDVARNAVTLIAPPSEQLAPPPQLGETIVIFTDDRTRSQCSYCAPVPMIPVDALERSIQSLYGAAASGQVTDERVSSHSLADLQGYLAGFADDAAHDQRAVGRERRRRFAAGRLDRLRHSG